MLPLSSLLPRSPASLPATPSDVSDLPVGAVRAHEVSRRHWLTGALGLGLLGTAGLGGCASGPLAPNQPAVDATDDARKEHRLETNRRSEQFFRTEASIGME